MIDTDQTIEGELRARGGPAVSDAIRSIESYETDDSVVLYDSENPLAWIQADETVDLDSAA